MKRFLRVLLLSSLAVLFVVGTAMATLINFRDPAHFGGDNELLYETSVMGFDLRFDAMPDGAKLYWGIDDGYGVRWDYEYDEIEGSEFLELTFSNSPVDLSRILITDLFADESRDGNTYDEFGWYALNGGSKKVFSAADVMAWENASNGEFFLDIDGGENVTSITFSAPGILGGEDHEFSVAGVDVRAVPEPTNVLLLGTGLIGLARLGRKKFFKRSRNVNHKW